MPRIISIGFFSWLSVPVSNHSDVFVFNEISQILQSSFSIVGHVEHNQMVVVDLTCSSYGDGGIHVRPGGNRDGKSVALKLIEFDDISVAGSSGSDYIAIKIVERRACWKVKTSTLRPGRKRSASS